MPVSTVTWTFPDPDPGDAWLTPDEGAVTGISRG